MHVTSPAPWVGVSLRWDRDSPEEQLGRETEIWGGLSSASCSPRGAATAAKALPGPFMAGTRAPWATPPAVPASSLPSGTRGHSRVPLPLTWAWGRGHPGKMLPSLRWDGGRHGDRGTASRGSGFLCQPTSQGQDGSAVAPGRALRGRGRLGFCGGSTGRLGFGDPCPVQSPVPGSQQVMRDVWCRGVFPVPNTP